MVGNRRPVRPQARELRGRDLVDERVLDRFDPVDRPSAGQQGAGMRFGGFRLAGAGGGDQAEQAVFLGSDPAAATRVV
ncbi:MAG: hypothetical protein ACFE0R_17810, partial [Salinarimonas sp.]